MLVRCFTFYRGGYFFGWIVRYIRDDYAEIAPVGGGPHGYLHRGAVQGWERLWEGEDHGR